MDYIVLSLRAMELKESQNQINQTQQQQNININNIKNFINKVYQVANKQLPIVGQYSNHNLKELLFKDFVKDVDKKPLRDLYNKLEDGCARHTKNVIRIISVLAVNKLLPDEILQLPAIKELLLLNYNNEQEVQKSWPYLYLQKQSGYQIFNLPLISQDDDFQNFLSFCQDKQGYALSNIMFLIGLLFSNETGIRFQIFPNYVRMLFLMGITMEDIKEKILSIPIENLKNYLDKFNNINEKTSQEEIFSLVILALASGTTEQITLIFEDVFQIKDFTKQQKTRNNQYNFLKNQMLAAGTNEQSFANFAANLPLFGAYYQYAKTNNWEKEMFQLLLILFSQPQTHNFSNTLDLEGIVYDLPIWQMKANIQYMQSKMENFILNEKTLGKQYKDYLAQTPVSPLSRDAFTKHKQKEIQNFSIDALNILQQYIKNVERIPSSVENRRDYQKNRIIIEKFGNDQKKNEEILKKYAIDQSRANEILSFIQQYFKIVQQYKVLCEMHQLLCCAPITIMYTPEYLPTSRRLIEKNERPVGKVTSEICFLAFVNEWGQIFKQSSQQKLLHMWITGGDTRQIQQDILKHLQIETKNRNLPNPLLDELEKQSSSQAFENVLKQTIQTGNEQQKQEAINISKLVLNFQAQIDDYNTLFDLFYAILFGLNNMSEEAFSQLKIAMKQPAMLQLITQIIQYSENFAFPENSPIQELRKNPDVIKQIANNIDTMNLQNNSQEEKKANEL